MSSSESDSEDSPMAIPSPPTGSLPPPDLGGLGGRAAGAVLKPPTDAERRLKRHIKFFKTKYPHIDINKSSELEHLLLGLNEAELRDIVDSIKSQVGTLSPFASIEKVIQFMGLGVERKFDMPGRRGFKRPKESIETRPKAMDPVDAGAAVSREDDLLERERLTLLGFQAILCSDPDLVHAMDELVPSAFHNLAAPLQLLWSAVKAFIDCNEQKGKIPIPLKRKAEEEAQDEPPTKKQRNVPSRKGDMETAESPSS